VKFDTLQVILKVAERCNLSCTYCYYFYAGDESYQGRPPVMKESTASEIATFLREGVARMSNIDRVLIAFHGGEPTLLKVERFREFCRIFREALPKVGFQMQTNGVLIDDAWIAAIKEFDVNVGVSIDGPEAENDKFRIMNDGSGSYRAVIDGLRRLQRGSSEQGFVEPGTISVVNPTYDYRRIFNHLHLDLGVNAVSFLLPDCQHDTGLPLGIPALRYGEILCDIFDAWVESGGKAQVRQIDRFLSYFQKMDVATIPVGKSGKSRRTQVIVIQSDGDLAIDDTYMLALDWRQSQATPNVASTSLDEHLARPVFADIDRFYATTPKQCESCCWNRVCGGGDLENRYSRENGFDNPSVFCDGLKKFYAHVTKHLITNGYPEQEAMKVILGEEVA